MAIDYTNLFEDLGEYVEGITTIQAWAKTSLPALEVEIEAQLVANSQAKLVAALVSQITTWQGQLSQMCSGLVTLATTRLTDTDTVAEQLWLNAGAGISTVLGALVKDMISNSETVQRNVCSLGSVVPDALNNGSGTVLHTLVLDGTTAPGNGFPAVKEYKGVSSELCVPSETMRLVCVRDSQTDRVANGSEQFQWSGETGNSGYTWDDEGSGSGPTVTCINGANILIGGALDTWVSNVPSGWTLYAGTAGTHILTETTDVVRGTGSCHLVGDGAQATIELRQTISAGRLVPNKGYCITAWVKGEAGIGSGQLNIQLEGTGYTPGATEKIEMSAATLAATTAWTLQYAFVNAPAVMPSDLRLVVRMGGTLESAKNVYIDDVCLGPVVWHGGVGAVVVAGADVFLDGDTFTFTVANNQNGAFQEFFRRAYKVQLPSSGSPTINDALMVD